MGHWMRSQAQSLQRPLPRTSVTVPSRQLTDRQYWPSVCSAPALTLQFPVVPGKGVHGGDTGRIPVGSRKHLQIVCPCRPRMKHWEAALTRRQPLPHKQFGLTPLLLEHNPPFPMCHGHCLFFLCLER